MKFFNRTIFTASLLFASMGSVLAQDFSKSDFMVTLAKNFKADSRLKKHSFFAIRFTTDALSRVVKMDLSNNTDSLMRIEIDRLKPKLNLQSLSPFLQPSTEVILPVITIYQDTPIFKDRPVMDLNFLDFEGNENFSKSYQVLAPLIVDRYARGEPIEDYAPVGQLLQFPVRPLDRH